VRHCECIECACGGGDTHVEALIRFCVRLSVHAICRGCLNECRKRKEECPVDRVRRHDTGGMSADALRDDASVRLPDIDAILD
jgi:hypothetical protein